MSTPSTTLPVPACKAATAVGFVPTLSADEITALRAEFVACELAPSTVRSYSRHIRDFTAFCDVHGVNALPASADTIAAFLTEYGLTHRPSTLEQVVAAIRWWHARYDLPSATSCAKVRSVLRGHLRKMGAARRKKAAVTPQQMRAVCDLLDSEGTPAAIRDKALLLLGYAGAFRRSELVALTFDDLEFLAKGLSITIRRSKTDQFGKGDTKPIPYGTNAETCPITALRAWMRELERHGHVLEGAVFRPFRRAGGFEKGDVEILEKGLCDRTVARTLKARLAQIGIADVAKFSGHSLRSGHITAAGEAGFTAIDIMQTSLHKSIDMIREYTQRGDKLKRPSGLGIGL